MKTAGYVIVSNGEPPLLEQCYFAAYESDTSVLNYLRALLNGCENEKKRKELQKVFVEASVYKDDGSFDIGISIHVGAPFGKK